MKRLLLLGFAICAFAFAPTLPASAMPVAKQQPVVTATNNDVVQVRGHPGDQQRVPVRHDQDGRPEPDPAGDAG